MSEGERDTFAGLGDIISNLMALFILLTIFVLVSYSTVIVESAGQNGRGGETRARFSNIGIDPLGGATNYFFITSRGIAVLDANWVANRIADRGQSTPLLTEDAFHKNSEQGDASSEMVGAEVNLVMETDLEFTMEFSIPSIPDSAFWPAVPAQSALEIFEKYKIGNSDLSLYVTPEGFDSFLKIYAILKENGRCFRWRPWSTEYDFRLKNFTFIGQRRCPAI